MDVQQCLLTKYIVVLQLETGIFGNPLDYILIPKTVDPLAWCLCHVSCSHILSTKILEVTGSFYGPRSMQTKHTGVSRDISPVIDIL